MLRAILFLPFLWDLFPDFSTFINESRRAWVPSATLFSQYLVLSRKQSRMSRKICQNATRGRAYAGFVRLCRCPRGAVGHNPPLSHCVATQNTSKRDTGSDLRGITAQGHRMGRTYAVLRHKVTGMGRTYAVLRHKATGWVGPRRGDLAGCDVPHGIRPQAFYQSVTVASVIGMVTLISTSPRVMLNTTVEPTRALIIHSVALCVRSAS